MDPESGQMFPGVLIVDGWKLEAVGEEAPLEWAEPDCAVSDSESEGVLHAVDPNEVFPSGLQASSSSSSSSSSTESDSGVSEEPVATVAPVTMTTAQPTVTTVYQVVYDINGVGGASEEQPGQENMISIELDEWSSRLLLSDSCIVNELPVLPVARPSLSSSSSSSVHPSPNEDLLYPDLQLTEEEQTLLSQEGVSLPNNLPLTKAEERILKKVRRKIRNKQSAQDSRRRRKEYIDGLESRAAACTAQNRELQRSVEQLEKHNMSLLAQLRQLQSLIRKTVSKGAQTSTCLLIILVSLGLIILPSFSPFRRHSSEDEDYRPTGVISRNILTDPSSSQPAGGDAPLVSLDSSSPPSDLIQSGPAETSPSLQEPIEIHQNSTLDPTDKVDGQSGNSSETVVLETKTMSGIKSRDAKKPGRADEM